MLRRPDHPSSGLHARSSTAANASGRHFRASGTGTNASTSTNTSASASASTSASTNANAHAATAYAFHGHSSVPFAGPVATAASSSSVAAQIARSRLWRLVFLAAIAMILLIVSDSLVWQNLSMAMTLPAGPLHFCRVPTVQTVASDPHADPFDVPHRCAGPNYDAMTQALHRFADDVATHGRTWGRRTEALPPNTRVLMIGNADTQNIAFTLACQYAAQIQTDADHPTVLAMHFPNNATVVLTVDSGVALANATSPQGGRLAFDEAVQRTTGHAAKSFDAIVWGLLHDCGIGSSACTNETAALYFAAADVYAHNPPPAGGGPMLFIGMMADARADQSLAMRDAIRATKVAGPRKLWFISGRRYISQVRMEGATIYGNGDADNAPKTGKIGHRCTGDEGGHADLIAFDVIEFLHQHLGM